MDVKWYLSYFPSLKFWNINRILFDIIKEAVSRGNVEYEIIYNFNSSV